MGVRYYDAALGRFVSKTQSVFTAGLTFIRIRGMTPSTWKIQTEHRRLATF